ncbi:hypothetical protein OKW33_006073 [Paraburkholderia atlantica]
MIAPVFATLNGCMDGLRKSIRRRCGDRSPRHDEFAPDSPKKHVGFAVSRYFPQGVRQAGVPFMSSASTVAKPGGTVQIEVSGLNMVVFRVNEAWCADNAHAIRANLLASAQATTLECRLASIERTHSASGPALLETLCM